MVKCNLLKTRPTIIILYIEPRHKNFKNLQVPIIKLNNKKLSKVNQNQVCQNRPESVINQTKKIQRKIYIVK
jgi:hypothetical protein